MRTEPVDYILTTLSATMFGERASIYQRVISYEEAQKLINERTQIVATRPSHDHMAKRLFGINLASTRFADMSPDTAAVHIHYRGSPIKEDGKTPANSVVTYYLMETEPYEE